MIERKSVQLFSIILAQSTYIILKCKLRAYSLDFPVKLSKLCRNHASCCYKLIIIYNACACQFLYKFIFNCIHVRTSGVRSFCTLLYCQLCTNFSYIFIKFLRKYVLTLFAKYIYIRVGPAL